MRELQLIRTGRLEWREAPAPRIEAPGQALVRPLAVARCDLDAGILQGLVPFRGQALHWLRDHLPAAIGQRRLFRNAPFKGPYAFGHECVAEVVEQGPDVKLTRAGDRVVVPFQISCGACERCQRGLTASCSGVPARSMYGFGDLGGRQWGGVLADLVRVPFADAMLVPLPAGVEPATAASAGDNIADGLRAVAKPLADAPGAAVLIMGGGALSVGLYAAGAAVALGARRIDYVDLDAGRLEVARRLGANAIERDFELRPERYPITVDATADARGLSTTLRATEPGGTCTSVGIYYGPTAVPLLEMYGSGVTFHTGRAHCRTLLPQVLTLLGSGRLHAELVTSKLAAWDEAAEAMLAPGPKVVVQRAS